MPFPLLSTLLVVVVLAGAGPAAAEPSAREVFEAAVSADDAGRYDEALEGYRAAVAADPSARFAARAMARIRGLEALVVDPALTGLSDLRRDYERLGSEAAVTRAEGLLEAATTDAGRIEARLWLANEFALVVGDGARAVEHFLAVAADPAAPPGTVESALLLAGRAADTAPLLRAVLAAHARVREARDDLDPAGLRSARDEVRDALQRRWARPIAGATFVGLLALAAVRRRWDRVRARSWRGPAALGYAFVVGAILSHYWEHGYEWAFLAAAPVAVVTHVVAVCAGSRDDAGTADRAATAMLVALATVGAIYLVFDAFGRQAVFGL